MLANVEIYQFGTNRSWYKFCCFQWDKELSKNNLAILFVQNSPVCAVTKSLKINSSLKPRRYGVVYGEELCYTEGKRKRMYGRCSRCRKENVPCPWALRILGNWSRGNIASLTRPGSSGNYWILKAVDIWQDERDMDRGNGKKVWLEQG